MFKNRKILFVLQNDLLGGAEQNLKSLATEFKLRGDDIHVIIMKAPIKYNWDYLNNHFSVKYINTKTYYLGIFKLIYFLIKYTNQYEFDYTISSNININFVLGFLKKIKFLKTKKLIIRETTSFFLRMNGLKKNIGLIKYTLGYSSADLIICQTDLMKNQMLINIKKSINWNIRTIHNPIDIFTINILSKELPNDLPNKNYIISAGRFIFEKGFDVLIKAFKKVTDYKPDLVLIILGEGKLLSEYKNLISKLNLDKKVLLLGFKNNPIPYFKYANLCIVSSRLEGFPNVLLQMAAVNNKVLTTPCAEGVNSIPSVYICPIDNVDLMSISILNSLDAQVNFNLINEKIKYLNTLTVSNYLSSIDKLVHA